MSKTWNAIDFYIKKANDNVSSQSLNVYMKRYKPKYAIRISTKNFGIANNIKSLPLYAAFLVK